jgi:GT2 family glycosyltransferase
VSRRDKAVAIDLTVVIPTYNRRAMLREAVESLRVQSHPRDRYEIVIVSDGSTDGTDEQYGAPPRDPAMRLVRQEKRGFGLASARNLGLSAAAGELVLFFDDDMVAAPELIATHVRTHAAFDESVAVCGRVEPAADIPDTPFCRLVIGDVCRGFRTDIGQARFISFESAFSWQTSFKRNVLRRLGGYDETFRRYGWEDIEFAFRAAGHGLRFFYEPGAVSFHRDGRATVAAHGERLRTASRAAPFLFARHPDLRSRIPMYADKEPIEWSADRIDLIGWKVFRTLLARRGMRSLLERMTPLVERALPWPWLLRRWYFGVLGSYIFLGYREGLAEMAATGGAAASSGASEGPSRR